MINRSQSATDNRTDRIEMEEYSDNDSNGSMPDPNPRNFNVGINEEQMINQERDHERIRIEQRFNDMKRQIEELTSLIRTLTETITSSSRDENDSKVSDKDANSSLLLFLFAPLRTKSCITFKLVQKNKHMLHPSSRVHHRSEIMPMVLKQETVVLLQP